MLTLATIHAAQDNDLSAVTAVVEAMESRVNQLAEKAARRVAPHGGLRLAEYRDEFAQVGRVAVWDALKRFADGSVDAFERFMYTTIERTLLDAVRSERDCATGADDDAMKVFAAMVEAADGDVFEAEKLAQTIPPKGRRLSATRANAARLAWQGNVSLDRQNTRFQSYVSGSAVTGTLTDMLPVYDAEPDGEIRPKVGHGAALEALAVLERYGRATVARMTPNEFTANLPTLVAWLEETVTVPADPTERRYVLDAMAVLRSAVSTATEGALDDDLRDVRDDRMAESREKHNRVSDCLASMGEGQRTVLTHSFGIGGASDFGWGDGCDLDGLCALLGMTRSTAVAARSKGRKAFAKRYVAAVKLSGAEGLAAVLEAAAAATLTNAGRK